MQLKPLIPKLILVFKRLSTLGFLAAGAMIIGLSYKGYLKVYGDEAEKHRWVFVLLSIFVILVLMFMYFALF
jgi:hypothetical protein